MYHSEVGDFGCGVLTRIGMGWTMGGTVLPYGMHYPAAYQAYMVFESNFEQTSTVSTCSRHGFLHQRMNTNGTGTK